MAPLIPHSPAPGVRWHWRLGWAAMVRAPAQRAPGRRAHALRRRESPAMSAWLRSQGKPGSRAGFDRRRWCRCGVRPRLATNHSVLAQLTEAGYRALTSAHRGWFAREQQHQIQEQKLRTARTPSRAGRSAQLANRTVVLRVSLFVVRRRPCERLYRVLCGVFANLPARLTAHTPARQRTLQRTGNVPA